MYCIIPEGYYVIFVEDQTNLTIMTDIQINVLLYNY